MKWMRLAEGMESGRALMQWMKETKELMDECNDVDEVDERWMDECNDVDDCN